MTETHFISILDTLYGMLLSRFTAARITCMADRIVSPRTYVLYEIVVPIGSNSSKNLCKIIEKKVN